MLHVGLDTHYRTSTMCILDHNGRKIKHETVRGGRARLLGRPGVNLADGLFCWGFGWGCGVF